MQTILFFDLDATLIENGFSRKAIAPLLQELADATDENLDTIFDIFENENLRRQTEDPDNVLTMDWNDILITLASRYAVTLSDTIDNRWQEVANADDVEILDDAPVVLKSLQQAQRKIVLSTKGLLKYQMPVLEVTGLKQFFDDILTPDITGYLKTTPDFFAKYKDADALKIQIGDHYYDDVICAKRNGFHSVMRAPIAELTVYDPFDRPQRVADFRDRIRFYPDEVSDILPDAVVTSLKELPDVIKRIESQQ